MTCGRGGGGGCFDFPPVTDDHLVYLDIGRVPNVEAMDKPPSYILLSSSMYFLLFSCVIPWPDPEALPKVKYLA